MPHHHRFHKIPEENVDRNVADPHRNRSGRCRNGPRLLPSSEGLVLELLERAARWLWFGEFESLGEGA